MRLSAYALFVVSWAMFAAVVPVPDKTFEFHSSFWFNLHHFLLQQASAPKKPPAVAPEWDAAVDYYHREIVKLTGKESVDLDNELSALQNTKILKNSRLPGELESILNRAAPIYRARWWQAHDRGNRTWIKAVSPLISKHSAALKLDLARAYATTWPSTPIRTDVAEYANWAGAYTTIDPSHIIVSSADAGYQGEAALEVLFHEASHTIFTAIFDRLSSEARAQNRLYRRRDFWHAVLFYTSGEMVRSRLGDGYASVADKILPTWPGAAEVLDRNWKPYLDGKIDLDTAVRRMLDDYGVATTAAH